MFHPTKVRTLYQKMFIFVNFQSHRCKFKLCNLKVFDLDLKNLNLLYKSYFFGIFSAISDVFDTFPLYQGTILDRLTANRGC